jgi:hypothetical protein
VGFSRHHSSSGTSHRESSPEGGELLTSIMKASVFPPSSFNPAFIASFMLESLSEAEILITWAWTLASLRGHP